MCIIIDNSVGANLDDDVLTQAAIQNPHGGGIIDVDSGKVFRSMNMNLIVDKMRTIDKWICHTRWATVGPKTKSNCHPYKVKDEWFLMMNGTVQISAPKGWSDTRSVAEMIKMLQYCVPTSTKCLRRNRLNDYLGFPIECNN